MTEPRFIKLKEAQEVRKEIIVKHKEITVDIMNEIYGTVLADLADFLFLIFFDNYKKLDFEFEQSFEKTKDDFAKEIVRGIYNHAVEAWKKPKILTLEWYNDWGQVKRTRR